MISPPLSVDETERLSALYQLKILETPIEERFERITPLAKRIFDVPIVAVTLVDEKCQWFKSTQGLTVCEMS